MGPNEGVIVVFSPEAPGPAVVADNVSELVQIAETRDALSLEGFDATGGRKHLRVEHGGRTYVAEETVAAPPAPLRLEGPFGFRLEPTLDNRWGDFRCPASETVLGAEARQFRYFEEEDGVVGTEQGWHRAEFDDTQWPEVLYSYGPYWWHLGGFPPGTGPTELIAQARRGVVDVQRAWRSGLQQVAWQHYSFSKKFGSFSVWPTCSLPFEFFQLFGGLLGVSENFLVLNQPAPGGDAHYFFTNVHAPKEGEYFLYAGVKPYMAFASGSIFEPGSLQDSVQPSQVPIRTRAWVNGEELSIDLRPEHTESRSRVHLRVGWNTVLLEVVRPEEGPVALYAVFLQSEPPQEDRYVPLLRWFREPQPLIYDITPEKEKRVGWYRFPAPPGVREIRLLTQAQAVQAWVDGESVPIQDGRISFRRTRPQVSQAALWVEQEAGTYAGAVFPEPVAFETEAGQIPLGDWSEYGLATYSGIGVYSREFRLERAHLRGKVMLDLGHAQNVAEVFVNGKSAGVGLARPFRFDITGLVRSGRNTLEVKVANTLANHMTTYPTKWVLEGQTVSGLLGPVELQFYASVDLTAKKAE